MLRHSHQDDSRTWRADRRTTDGPCRTSALFCSFLPLSNSNSTPNILSKDIAQPDGCPAFLLLKNHPECNMSVRLFRCFKIDPEYCLKWISGNSMSVQLFCSSKIDTECNMSVWLFCCLKVDPEYSLKSTSNNQMSVRLLRCL